MMLLIMLLIPRFSGGGPMVATNFLGGPHMCLAPRCNFVFVGQLQMMLGMRI
jgi:hypothetical protein